MNTLPRLLLVFSLGALAIGCHPSQGPVVQVTGHVTYKGVNLQGGYIVFVPDASRGESGPIAYSKIAGDGSYDLTTGDAHGVATGWYRVTVSSVGPALPGGEHAFPTSVIPPQYRDPDKSQLACEVKAEHGNNIDFHLK